MPRRKRQSSLKSKGKRATQGGLLHAGFRVFTMSKRAPAGERFAALTSPVRLPYPSATQTALERAETLPEVDGVRQCKSSASYLDQHP